MTIQEAIDLFYETIELVVIWVIDGIEKLFLQGDSNWLDLTIGQALLILGIIAYVLIRIVWWWDDRKEKRKTKKKK